MERPQSKREHKLSVLNKLRCIVVRIHNRYSCYKMYYVVSREISLICTAMYTQVQKINKLFNN